MHPIETTGTYRLVITPDRTAAAVGSGTLAVCATPIIAAAAEGAAVAALAPYMTDGETTVGTHLAIDHLAATPVGMTITATATLMQQNGRRYEFSFSCCDDAGEVACGTHTRVVVNSERFLAKAAQRRRSNDT